MKFFLLTALAAFAKVSLAAYCYSEKCNPSKVPNTVYSGKLTAIEVAYKVTGTITIENDCVFTVKGFSIDKPADELKWYGAAANSNEGTILSKDVVASPASTTDLSYNIENTDAFCHTSLLDHVDVIRLMDKNFKLIAQATINKSSGNSGGSAPAQSGSAGASKPTGASGTGASKPTGASGTGASTGAATAPAPAATNTIAGNNTASNPIKSGSTTSNKASGAISLKAPSIALYIALFVLAFFRL